MGNKKFIVMSSIPDSAIDEMKELSKQWLDQSFKLDEEFEQKLNKDEARWPNKQYLIVPRACGKTNTTDEDHERFRKSWDGIVKDLTLNTTDKDVEEFRKSLGVTDSWHIEAEIKENPAERKKRLMRLEKEMLVDMVFNLESRNERLVNNLLEVEKMYNKLKEEIENG